MLFTVATEGPNLSSHILEKLTAQYQCGSSLPTRAPSARYICPNHHNDALVASIETHPRRLSHPVQRRLLRLGRRHSLHRTFHHRCREFHPAYHPNLNWGLRRARRAEARCIWPTSSTSTMPIPPGGVLRWPSSARFTPWLKESWCAWALPDTWC